MQENLDVGVTSVGLSMPSAFSVSNSPVTTSGNISVTGAGTVSQYIRGDGSLADFPQGGGGGGASVNYYLNGSVSQGTIGGVAYRELSKVPILGAGTDFTINADGYIASFITDAGDPSLLEIPGGNWNFETYFQASSGGGSPTFYVELYKVSAAGTATLIATSSGSPELIAFGTNTTPYFSSLAVPTTTLTLTDRLAIRFYVVHAGRTITLHTENNTLCQIITTFTTGLTALNGLTAQVQNFATGTSGTDFNISSASTTHTFNLPDASASNRGAVTTGTQTFAGNKTLVRNINVNGVYVGRGASGGDLFSGIAGNTSVGSSALISITTGFPNTALGSEALRNITTGANNIAIGSDAGKLDAGSGAANATSSSSIYIGNSTKPQSNGNTNEIVIGHASSGNGSNTTTIGNSSTTFNRFFGATLSDSFRLPSDGGGNQVTVFENIGTIHTGSAGSNIFGFNNSNNIYFGKGLSNGGVIQWTNAAVRYYTLPDADGTLALTSDITTALGDYVTLATTQNITGAKTFTTTTSTFAAMNSTNSNGGVLTFRRSGTNVGHIGNSAQLGAGVLDAIEVRSGVGSSVILRTDGGQLTLANGGGVTLTGALNGTSASFSGGVNSNFNGSAYNATATSTNNSFTTYSNNSGVNNTYIGLIGNNGVVQTNNDFEVFTGSSFTKKLTIASNGAATFSSSVTATQFITGGTPSNTAGFTNSFYAEGNIPSLTLSNTGTNTGKYTLGVTNGNFGIWDNPTSSYRLFINATGNVGIGTASPAVALDVNGVIHARSSSGIFSDRLTAYSGGNVNIAFGASGSLIILGGSGGAERARFTADGLTFNGDTSAANALDDYEEGTHSPNATPAGGGSFTTVTQSGSYVKVGQMVNYSFIVTINSVGTGTGDVSISLPFVCGLTPIRPMGSGRENALYGNALIVRTLSDGSANAVILGGGILMNGWQALCTITYRTTA
jgi:hypothetical protein